MTQESDFVTPIQLQIVDMYASEICARLGWDPERTAILTPKEITVNANKINVLAPVSRQKGIAKNQGVLDLAIEKDAEIRGIGMGVLSDGTPYLNQRGLAALCGVENAHVGTISSQWNDENQKPRIKSIKSVLEKSGFTTSAAHVSNSNRFEKWHERIELNFQSAPKDFFHVFNEAHTIIYELIAAGADIGEKFVVDISIGQYWGRYWEDNALEAQYGGRKKYPHRYPDSHPQSKSNPQESWCYPLASLGLFRQWLQDDYIEGGKFKAYLNGKVRRNELPPSVAQLAIGTVGRNSLTT